MVVGGGGVVVGAGGVTKMSGGAGAPGTGGGRDLKPPNIGIPPADFAGGGVITGAITVGRRFP